MWYMVGVQLSRRQGGMRYFKAEAVEEAASGSTTNEDISISAFVGLEGF